MSKSSAAASGVFNVLSRNGSPDAADSANLPAIDVRSLEGLSHSEISELIAEAVNPNDVSLDDGAVRRAIADAVSSVLSENDGADITNLPAELAEECYLRTLSNSTFNILIADIGASVQRATHGSAELSNNRMKEISDFVREAYRAQYNQFKQRGGQISRQTGERIARDVTRQVMDIFESYLE